MIKIQGCLYEKVLADLVTQTKIDVEFNVHWQSFECLSISLHFLEHERS